MDLSQPYSRASTGPALRVWTARLALALLICFFGGLMVWLSVLRYRGYNFSAFDLGNMSQAVWSAGQGRPLIFTSEGFPWSRLALHVEIFYFLLAPIYALWPSPVTLLVIQAVLYAAGAIPAYLLAQRHLGSEWAAVAVAAIYMLYPVGQTAVLFQFHGDTLAMPLLLFAIEALDRHAWRGYAAWLVLALSCKFYVAVPVTALGVVVWLQGERRAGAFTALLGIGWGIVAFGIIRPLFAPPEAGAITAGAANYLAYYFGQVRDVGQTFDVRLANGLIVFMPALFLGWRAPGWLLVAAATAVPVLMSSGPGPAYDYRYHHFALAVPFLVAAVIYGAAALRRRQEGRAVDSRRRPGYGYLNITLMVTFLFNSALVDTPLSPLFYVSLPGVVRGLHPSSYGVTERDAFKDAWLARNVPAGAAVMADNLLGTRLVNRPILYRTYSETRSLPEMLPDVDFVVLDALYDYAPGYSMLLENQGAIRLLLEEPAFHLTAAQDGLLLFSRDGPGLPAHVSALLPGPLPAPRSRFGDSVALVDAQIQPLGPRVFRLRYDWLALEPLHERPPLVAVTWLEELPHLRTPHLPTMVLLPTPVWPSDQLIREEFDLVVPDNVVPGAYSLRVAWYDSSSPYAYATDGRSRLGDEVEIATLSVK
jgi:uncharacterized membrane protein